MSKMKFFKCWLPLMVLLLALPLAACGRRASLNNFVDLPVLGARGGALAEGQVKGAILDACQKRGWVARELSPGLITASLEVRSHMAQVEIPYNGARYSIIYKNSVKLKYDASKNTIHNQYNNWVDYLRRDIDINLARL